MTACEVCWDAAFIRARLFGGHQADHYRALIQEQPHGDGHPLAAEQSEGGKP